MNKMQKQVRKFKQKLNGTNDLEVCYKLIDEEQGELLRAFYQARINGAFKYIRNSNTVTDVVDGMCDLIYVVFYLAEVMHIDLEPYFDEVQRTNMLKERGTGDHKIRKPEGWQPPRIAEMLAKGIGIIE